MSGIGVSRWSRGYRDLIGPGQSEPIARPARGATDLNPWSRFPGNPQVPALPQVPRPMRADDVLPERALLGDQDAVDELVNTVYASLQTAGPDDPTLETVSTFLRNGGSLETTAKELSVHPNTVRYRLKRTAETTGWDAADAREAYVLRTAIALGRMHTA